MDEVPKEVKIDSGVLGKASSVLVGAEEDMRDISDLAQCVPHTVFDAKIQFNVFHLHGNYASHDKYICESSGQQELRDMQEFPAQRVSARLRAEVNFTS